MTVLELKDKKAILEEEARKLIDTGMVESRKLEAAEEEKLKASREAIDELDRQIKELEETRDFSGIEIKTKKMEKRFSLLRAINDIAEGRSLDSEVQDIFNEGREEMRKAGVEGGKGQIVLPTETRSTIVSGQPTGTTAGGYVVGKDMKTILPPLTNYLILPQAGATFLTGLVGNVEIPTYSGTTIAWKGEVTTAVDGAGTFGHVSLTPKRLTAFVDVSKTFLLQDAVGAEAMLMANLQKATAAKLESTILGAAAAATTYPAGLFSTLSVTKPTTLSWAEIVGLETDVDASNALLGSLGYITNASGRGLLKVTAKVSSTDSRMIMEDNTVNGYPVWVTNGVAGKTDFTTTGGDGLIFGNWADLLIGQWAGYDILVDPYTQAALGTVRLVVNAYFDAAIARSASFSAIAIK